MLKLLDTNGQLIKQWQIESNHTPIEFTAHSSALISFTEDTKSITVFYGFLDQDFNQNTPAEYVGKLLIKLGISGLNDCFGSFIVIHFDKTKQQWNIANDALGDFAVHYIKIKNTLHVSDLPQALLRHSKSINHQRILHYFALSKPQNNACFFNDIKQLNPGHSYCISNNNQKINRYYFPKQTINKRIECSNQLAEQFRSLMQSAIAFQTQGQKQVGVMMSGGMDSTFVAANCQKADKQVKAFSYVFPNMPAANESIWLDAMRNKGFDMHTFAGEPHWPLKSPWYVSVNSPINNPYRHLKTVIYQQAQNQQIKFLLSGVYADHLYTGYIYWLVDQIKYKPLSAIKSFYHTIKNHGFITGLRQVSPSKFSHKLKFNAPWMNNIAANELSKIINNYAKIPHPHSQQFNLVYGPSTAQSVWLDHEHGFKHNLYVRHPFRDRRVVEFMMDLPAWVLGNLDNRKQFVRFASQELLPKSIINRSKITTLQPLFYKGVLDKEWQKVKQILTDSSCQWQDYVNQKIINNILKNPTENHKDSELVILWQCINYEMWRRRLIEG